MLIESVLGNVDDPDRRAQLGAVTVDALVLDRWEAQRNRLRKTTEGGIPVALALDRGRRLRDGDILSWDRTTGTAIVVRVRLGEVMVVDLSGLAAQPPGDALRTAVEVGHALGNQHWPAVVRDARVYVPVTVDRAAMDAVMRTHAFRGVTHRFTAGTEAAAVLSSDEARRVFGGAAQVPHRHPPGTGGEVWR
ncbi:urease accessory protein UreE [Planosporangium sp. 12N6]|uniref:urease accessory protein UreE n=1 Tax=Planosporangium spinosum TaxID=3402278 RepID=UPI003CEC6E29